MTKTLLNTEVIEEVKGAVVIGPKNVVANPGFQNNTNFWSASALTLTLTGSGVYAEGSGVLYQLLNATDVVNGTAYMARAYCNTVSGTWKLLMGSAVDSSSLVSQNLTAGWNSVRFTAGADSYVQLKSVDEASTDTIVVSPVEVREQLDVEVTGQIRDLDIEYGDIYFSSGSVTVPSISFESDKDTGIYLASTADMRLGASGIAQVAIKGSATHVLSALVVNASAIVVSNLNVSGALTVGTTGTFTGSINAAGATFASNIKITGVSASIDNAKITGSAIVVTGSNNSGYFVHTASALVLGGNNGATGRKLIIDGEATVDSMLVFNLTGQATFVSTLTVTGSINAAGATLLSGLIVGSNAAGRFVDIGGTVNGGGLVLCIENPGTTNAQAGFECKNDIDGFLMTVTASQYTVLSGYANTALLNTGDLNHLDIIVGSTNSMRFSTRTGATTYATRASFAAAGLTVTGSINVAGVTSNSGVVVGGAGLASANAVAGAIIYSNGAFYGFTGSTYVTF